MLVVGAGGFAIQILHAIERSQACQAPVFFCDSRFTPDPYLSAKFRIIQTIDEAQDYLLKEDERFCLGVGIGSEREDFCNKFQQLGGNLISVVDPSAILPEEIRNQCFGVSCLAQVIIEPSASIGKGVLLNLGSMVTHHVQLGDFTEIGPGAKLLGRSVIGSRSLIGSGSIILPGVSVGDNVIIGAGSVVTRDLPNDVKAFGTPARIVSTK